MIRPRRRTVLRPTGGIVDESGLRIFEREHRPRWESARLDKVNLNILGTVTARGEEELREWHRMCVEIAYQNMSMFHIRSGNRLPWMELMNEHFSISGRVTFHTVSATPERTSVRFQLKVNPTRTLNYLMMRNIPYEWLDSRENSPLSEMSPAEFFFCDPDIRVRMENSTLDQSTNVLGWVRTLGGDRIQDRSYRWGNFLYFFELKLRELLTDFVSRDHSNNSLEGDHSNNGIVGNLNWTELSVPKAEVYWEYGSLQAHEYMRRIANHFIESARTTSISIFHGSDRTVVSRNRAALQALINLTDSGDSKLAIYEKMHNRLRFEVRYNRVPQRVRNQVRGHPRRLSALFQGLFDVAENDIRQAWGTIWDLLERDQENLPLASVLINLIDNIQQACSTCEYNFDTQIVDRVLVDGGVTPVGGNTIVPADVCQELVRLGVLSHRRFLLREPRDPSADTDAGVVADLSFLTRPPRRRRGGRRYTLTDEYQGLRSVLIDS